MCAAGLRHSVLLSLVLAVAAWTGPLAAAERTVPTLAPADPGLPIDLDAAFSEFDRRNNRLIFRNLRVTQGSLGITADTATADPANFDDSVWTFTGGVVIVNADTEARCERAELRFRGNRLEKAVLTGSPATFTQRRPTGEPTEGRSRAVEYDLAGKAIRLLGDAWLSDGTNEITGSSIAYDLAREVVTAGAGDGGNVRMRIKPKSMQPAPR
jgi:lipopolysaccharide export system protein LptA